MEATNLSPLLAGCPACTETCYCEACCDALGDAYDAAIAAPVASTESLLVDLCRQPGVVVDADVLA